MKGHAYIAAPQCGGAGQPQCTPQSAEDGQLFGLYFEVAGSGIVVKLKGSVSVDPATGQLTTTFRETPQLPFTELTLTLHGGQRAPLSNPQVRHVHRDDGSDAVEHPGDAGRDAALELRHRRLHGRLRPGPAGGDREPGGGRLQPVHADPLPQGW